MKCPLCDTEMRIKGSSYVTNNGGIYIKQIYTCRKKDCPNFGKDVTAKYSSLGDLTEDSEAEVESE